MYVTVKVDPGHQSFTPNAYCKSKGWLKCFACIYLTTKTCFKKSSVPVIYVANIFEKAAFSFERESHASVLCS